MLPVLLQATPQVRRPARQEALLQALLRVRRLVVPQVPRLAMLPVRLRATPRGQQPARQGALLRVPQRVMPPAPPRAMRLAAQRAKSRSRQIRVFAVSKPPARTGGLLL
jgi:hypothetical protein